MSGLKQRFIISDMYMGEVGDSSAAVPGAYAGGFCPPGLAERGAPGWLFTPLPGGAASCWGTSGQA